MKKANIISCALLALVSVVVFSGCMTPVTVQTDPPGAVVYCRGSGRPAYKWKPRGMTEAGKPVTFRVPYNAIETYAVWPAANGRPAVRSQKEYTKLLFKEDPVILLKK